MIPVVYGGRNVLFEAIGTSTEISYGNFVELHTGFLSSQAEPLFALQFLIVVSVVGVATAVYAMLVYSIGR